MRNCWTQYLHVGTCFINMSYWGTWDRLCDEKSITPEHKLSFSMIISRYPIGQFCDLRVTLKFIITFAIGFCFEISSYFMLYFRYTFFTFDLVWMVVGSPKVKWLIALDGRLILKYPHWHVTIWHNHDLCLGAMTLSLYVDCKKKRNSKKLIRSNVGAPTDRRTDRRTSYKVSLADLIMLWYTQHYAMHTQYTRICCV